MSAVAAPRRERFYFGPDEGLYGTCAGDPGATRAVCIAAPTGTEAIRARRPLWRVCGALAAAGAAGLLFEPRGTGESAGELGESTVPGMTEDVAAALDELGRRFPSASPLVVAFRYTAIAALALPQGRRPERLLLVDPCLSPERSLRADMRLEVTKVTRERGRPDVGRDAMLERLRGGEPVILDSQLISPSLYGSLVEAEPRAWLEAWGDACTVVRSGAEGPEAVHLHDRTSIADRAPVLERLVVEWAA